MADDRYLSTRLQDDGEWSVFLDLLRREKISNYLEIGCKFGGTLWSVATSVLPNGARVVGVDMPNTWKNSRPDLSNCLSVLIAKGFDAHVVWGDSTNPATIATVTSLGPFDCCFIDADHTERFVRSDWRNYGPLCRMVAFHDISFVAQPGQLDGKRPIDCKRVWDDIKKDYRHIEITKNPIFNGIGVLWRV